MTKRILLSSAGVLIYIVLTGILYSRRFSNISPSLLRIVLACAIGLTLLVTKIMPLEQWRGIGKKSSKTYRYPIIFSCLYFLLYMVLYAALFGLQHFEIANLQTILSTLTFLIAVSLFEEVIARAFLVNYMQKIWNSRRKHAQRNIALFSGALFGILHFLNYRTLTLDCVCQCVTATCIGVFLCAVFIRQNRLLPVIVAHTIINLSAALIPLIYNMDVVSQNHEMLWFLSPATSVLSLPFFLFGVRLFHDAPDYAADL